MKKPVIAIDGYSSTGKSSISKIIAQKLGIIHLDTGALYRGVTWFALQNCLSDDGSINLQSLFSSFDEIELEFKNDNGELVLFLNHIDISKAIRTNEVSENVSFVAKQKEVRDFLLQSQRSLAEKGGIIMDGRDIGTVVLPNADYKFFLTASIDERTKRRYQELISLGIEANEQQVKENLIIRDKIDSEREIAPLKQADDAIVIDNTTISKEETIESILSYIKNI
ncbi:(d)CMP kinase [Chryseobacterium sp. MHB01]|jgi:cytidylate kinase|uniref:(d)CMP kinase n=1 Tax=Chryseobacterium TaxID=59732 RepID=UPI002AFE66FB|nr:MULTISPECIES: (d)CMP kinase [Chryseobacterium]MEA1849165.1 (d)CMP kinase [Chryseobacterium sp. MHB01]MEC5174598.1 cytidylate kinase [Chryseobacterium nepalense]